jgi:hypothetical protein
MSLKAKKMERGSTVRSENEPDNIGNFERRRRILNKIEY